MAYNSNKGNQHMGDVQYEGDPSDVQIDFENDFIALKTNGQQRLIVSGSSITSSVSFVPSGTLSHDLGSTALAWDNLYVGDISASVNISASAFYGEGGSLTNLSANQIEAGTLHNDRLPATISVTSVTASSLVSASFFYGDGTHLTGISGGGASPGGPNQSIQFNTASSLSGSSKLTFDHVANLLSVTGDISASVNISGSDFYGAGTNLTNLNASNVSAGTLDNARLPTTVSVTNVSASSLVSASLFYGVGANLTSLNASNVSAGTLDNARLPATVSVTNVTASSLVSASFFYGDGRNLRNVNLPSVALHSSSFTASATSDILAINSSGSVITASLPAASTYIAGQRLSFKDVGGSGSTNNIAIEPSGSETIDGSAAGITITTNYGAIELFSNGVNSYHILSTN